jgi:predicted DCC family thiol-disulfide oxidoreductase YuxK
MSTTTTGNNIWFVYDGDCPLCTNAALALKIKKKYGALNLVNAREEKNHFVLKELNKRKYDLDEGMIIYDGNRFYHGKDALSFMAKFGENRGLFNLFNKALFWSPWIATVTYPWMRGLRNRLLRQHNVAQLDNLDLKTEPTFKSIFGEAWQQLPVVMQKHYCNRPYTNDMTTVEGVLDTMCSGPMKYLAPILRLAGNVPPISAQNVPVSVRFESDPDSKAFTFNRTFHFSNRQPYRFKSRMLQIKDNQVIELMRFGFCWKASFHWEDNCVKLRHGGYAFKLFGHYIPMPLTLLIGAGNAIERPVDDDTFDMQVAVTHAWWGKVYEYKGRFQFKENT